MEPSGKLYVPARRSRAGAGAARRRRARRRRRPRRVGRRPRADRPRDLRRAGLPRTRIPPHCLRGTRGAEKILETKQRDPLPLSLVPFPPGLVAGPGRGPARDPAPEEELQRVHEPEHRPAARRARPRRDRRLRRRDRRLRRRRDPRLPPRGRRVRFVEDAARGLDEARDAAVHRRLARARSRVHDRRGGDRLPRLRDPSLLPMRATMVGHWFHSLADFATTWLPLAFFAILVLTAYLLWKTVGMMPRVRPTKVDSRSKSSVTWDDVAGVEEVARRADGGRRLPPRPEAVRAARREGAEGAPALRAARHRQDAAREGGRARVGRELLLRERVVVRRDVRRPRRRPHPQALPGGAQARARRSSSSTSSTPSARSAPATASTASRTRR